MNARRALVVGKILVKSQGYRGIRDVYGLLLILDIEYIIIEKRMGEWKNPGSKCPNTRRVKKINKVL